ncbi:hypothetical protein [Streptomyces sediminimaris]|uniref:hypothetical protein n=1 Tax=Streptomyces sediminimaris TaxID=3383721 RepID=UPI00399AEE99
MTGPEHYRQAEELLGYAEALSAEERGGREDMSFLAEAQVHATLALAAAQALSDPARSAPRATVPEWQAWQSAAGCRPDPLDEIA